MPRQKRTLEDMKKEVEEKTNGNIKIRSKYADNGTRSYLDFECKCGQIFNRTFTNFQKGSMLCSNCIQQQVAAKNKKDIDEIIKSIEATGCHYISGNYENVYSKLMIQCRCGNIYERSWERFNKGVIDCFDCINKRISESSKKYTPEEAKDVFASYGYNMIGQYDSAQTKTLCLCKRGHVCYVSLSQLPFHETCCYECYKIDNSGENHSHYKGGVTKFSGCLRTRLSHWTDTIKNLYNNTCPITGENDELAVHHLTALSIIFKNILNEHHLSIKQTDSINIFNSNDEYNKVLDDIIAAHNNDTGILISEKIHLLFHSEYGFGDNTPEQFDEFLYKHYNLRLSDIQVSDK